MVMLVRSLMTTSLALTCSGFKPVEEEGEAKGMMGGGKDEFGWGWAGELGVLRSYDGCETDKEIFLPMRLICYVTSSSLPTFALYLI